MSTYNGERFISEQVESILNQLPSKGELLIRDDGSTDSTLACIESFQDARVQILRGNNIGFARSFLTLLMMAPADTDFVMFSDQDDVWLPNKIERARTQLGAFDHLPALYCAAQMLTDEKLAPLSVTPPWPFEPSFAGALTENIVTGCTAALNRPAIRLLQSAGVPDRVQFHDWWIYLVISAFGKVIVDDKPCLLYRQHGRNQIGHGSGFWGRQAQKIRFIRRNDWVGIMLGQIGALVHHFHEKLSADQANLLKSYFLIAEDRVWLRWRLIFGLRRWRHSALNEFLFRILLLLRELHVWPLPWRRLKI